MFDALGAHPDIHPARVKEPEFFVRPEERAPVPDSDRSLEEYLDLFAQASDERWLLEASTAYLSSPEAPWRIRDFSPEARAIVMIRDPVEQLRSIHALRVSVRWQRSFDLLKDIEADGAYYWKRVRSGENLSRLLGVFPRDEFHVVVYDDFEASDATEYRRVLEFLGVDPLFTPEFRRLNSFETRNRVIRSIGRRVLPERVRQKARAGAAHLSRHPSPRPLDSAVAAYLWERVEPDVEVLSRLLDRDLVTLWRR